MRVLLLNRYICFSGAGTLSCTGIYVFQVLVLSPEQGYMFFRCLYFLLYRGICFQVLVLSPEQEYMFFQVLVLSPEQGYMFFMCLYFLLNRGICFSGACTSSWTGIYVFEQCTLPVWIFPYRDGSRFSAVHSDQRWFANLKTNPVKLQFMDKFS